MFTFNEIMFVLLKVWLVAIIPMTACRVISAAITGIRQGMIIAEISNNVHRKSDEIDDDMQKYYDYEVNDNDFSDNSNDNKA